MDHPLHKRNLSAFVQSLPLTNIQFMYINAYTKSVTVKSEFRVYSVNDHTYYMVPSEKNDGVYVYKESKLRYLLDSFSITNRDPIILSDVKFQDRVYRRNMMTGDKYDVNHGDHLTLFLLRSRSSPNTIIKTHFTHYQHNSNDFTFSRWSRECNFPLPKSFNNFSTTRCEHVDGSLIKQNTIETELQSRLKIDVVKDLCKQLLKHDHKPVMSGGKPMKYKTIDMTSDELGQFLLDTLFPKFFHLEFMFIYDQGNFISSDHIVILASDEEGYRSVIYIDPKRCMKACYTQTSE